MVFSSVVFLCAFLPVFYFLHILMPNIKLKNAVLVFASLLFYSFGEPVYIILLLASSLYHYLIGVYLGSETARHRKAAVAGVVVVNILILSVFKYSAFFVETLNALLRISLPVPAIRLPIGISFFTFQIMSYVLDVYRDRSLSQRNFFNVLLYIMFFPQLIAGPIVKYHDVAEQIGARSVTAEKTARGIERFVCGLAKKLLLANSMGLVADRIFDADPELINMPLAWLAALTYSLQIYYDFSGYSDMAIGLGKMFGFEFLENFNYPYSAVSMKDFWRRWHISLSTWFKEYLYIPLGGNRNGKARAALNRIIVFFLTGLWHGANFTFVVWGLYHGLFLLLEEYRIIPIEKMGFKPLRSLYTLVVASAGFVIFRARDLSQAWVFLRAAFAGYNFSQKSMSLFFSQFSAYFVFMLLIGVLLSFPLKRWLEKRLEGAPRARGALAYAGSAALLFLCFMSLASDSFNPFIYFQF